MNAINLLWVHTDLGTVTIKPHPKSPQVKLFYVGSSGSSTLSGDQRKNPITSLVIEFTVPKDGVPEKDLIVVETLLGDNRVSHLLELTWNRDGSSRIDLNHVWINIPGRIIQSFISKDGRTGLTVVVSGNIYTTHTDQAGSSKVDADVVCRYVSGRISDSDFLEGVKKVTGSASTNARNVAAEQLAQLFLTVVSIASEPLSFNPFRKGRIRRIIELYNDLGKPHNSVTAFRKYLGM